MLGNTLSDADSKRDLGLEGLLDTGSGDGRARDKQLAMAHQLRANVLDWPYGTKMAVAVAPVCFTPSETFLKTGRSR